MEHAYSLCEAMEFFLRERPVIAPSVSRIYLGSYFCDRYYCGISDGVWSGCFDYIRQHGAVAVLVIPTPSQQRLAEVKHRTDALLEQYDDLICELVVNDHGMLNWVTAGFPTKPIWLGRTMDKELRDPRYPLPGSHQKLLGQLEHGLCGRKNLIGVETDVPRIDGEATCPSGKMLGIHTPFAYMSMGRICELASIGLPPSEKFQLYRKCRRQCMDHWLWYTQNELSFLKYGRAVYTPVSQESAVPVDANVRIIESILAAQVGES